MQEEIVDEKKAKQHKLKKDTAGLPVKPVEVKLKKINISEEQLSNLVSPVTRQVKPMEVEQHKLKKDTAGLQVKPVEVKLKKINISVEQLSSLVSPVTGQVVEHVDKLDLAPEPAPLSPEIEKVKKIKISKELLTGLVYPLTRQYEG
jgi:Cu/Ag efflux protein CusF